MSLEALMLILMNWLVNHARSLQGLYWLAAGLLEIMSGAVDDANAYTLTKCKHMAEDHE